MPTLARYKTKYPGVYFVMGTATGRKKTKQGYYLSYRNGKKIGEKPERIYYIRYRKGGRLIEEKAGRQFQDNMTDAKAARIRSLRIEGKELSNQEQREAKRKQEEAEAAKWTIDRLWHEYMAHKPASKNLRTDEGRYKNYIRTAFGSREPKDLVKHDVDRLRLRLLKKRKPQTVKHILALLKRIINFGVNKGLCQGLQFRIELPQVNNLRTEELTPDQLSSLLEAMAQDHDIQAANIMRLALFTGLRRGELFKLKWEDLDFATGVIYIRAPKGSADQVIPLNQAARKVFDSHPRTDSPYVFPGRGGRQRTDINKAVNRIKSKARLPKKFRPLHGLRHVYASMLASSGQVDIYTLQKLLTHKSPQMTQRYAHFRDEELIRAADLAGTLIEHLANSKGQEQVVDLDEPEK